MLRIFLPNDYVKSVYDITPEFLMERNIKGIITDLDNTLVEWDRPLATPELIHWFKQMQDVGIQIVIVSNNNEKRVHEFASPINIPFVYKAQKPLGKSYKKALSILNLQKEETVVVGDQLLTDILGGNKSGFHTILVVPVVQTDSRVTRFNRMIERRILKSFNKKGLLNWEGDTSGK
jgi:uncharacterized protein